MEFLLINKVSLSAAAAGFTVYAGWSTVWDQTTLCNIDTGNDVNNNRVSVICRQRNLVRYVTVRLDGPLKTLEVCEIEVITGIVF